MHMKACDEISIMIFFCYTRADCPAAPHCIFLAQMLVFPICVGFSSVSSYVLCSSIQDRC